MKKTIFIALLVFFWQHNSSASKVEVIPTERIWFDSTARRFFICPKNQYISSSPLFNSSCIDVVTKEPKWVTLENYLALNKQKIKSGTITWSGTGPVFILYLE